MTKIFELTPRYCEFIPQIKEPGILYISERFGLSIHSCACGCGIDTVLPMSRGNWSLKNVDNKITIRPSIGNFMWEKSYHAHYYITNNKIEWL